MKRILVKLALEKIAENISLDEGYRAMKLLCDTVHNMLDSIAGIIKGNILFRSFLFDKSFELHRIFCNHSNTSI